MTEEFVGMAVRGLLYLIGLMLIFRRDRRTPVYYQLALAFIAVFSVTDLLMAARFHHIFHAYKVANGSRNAFVSRSRRVPA